MDNERINKFNFGEQERKDGSPAHIKTDHIDIKFQLGPIKEVGVNGCQIDEVLEICLRRLEGFQAGPFRSRENALAITKLEESLMWQRERTRKRQMQGVEGLNKPHV